MKRKGWSTLLAFGCMAMLFAVPATAQGIFDSTADWGSEEAPPQRGSFKIPGSVEVEGSGDSAVYRLQGNGDDIWDNNDEGFFVYTEREGSWSLEGKLYWEEPGTNPWSKIGVMIRENPMDPLSRHYWIILRGAAFGDRSDAQWRTSTGSGSGNTQIFHEDGNAVQDPGDGLYVRVTRVAALDLFYSAYSFDGEEWFFAHSQVQSDWPESAAYGLAITSHTDDEALVEATVSEVELNQAPPAGVRNLSTSAFTPGETLEVSLAINNPQDEAVTSTITETIPENWSASEISNGGSLDGNTITWEVELPPGETTLSYQATAPDSAQNEAVWSGAIDGLAIFGSQSAVGLQPAPEGDPLFDFHADIGDVAAAGDATYQDGVYEVFGSGADIWGTADEFHFLFREMNSPFVIQASIFNLPNESANAWVKAALMVRDTLDTSAVHYDTLVRTDLQVDSQWRLEPGASSGSTSSNMLPLDVQDGRLRIVRIGDFFQTWYFNIQDEEWQLYDERMVDMEGSVYAGLAVTSHEDGSISIGEYRDVSLTPIPFEIHRDLPEQFSGAEPFEVTLSAIIPEGETASPSVTETVPEGFTVTDLNASSGEASLDGNTVTWSLDEASGAPTLTYTVTADQTRTLGEWSGTVLTPEVDFDLPITGNDFIVGFLSESVLAEQDFTSDLEAYWSFDNFDGTTAADETGNGYDAVTLAGQPESIEGVVGNAIALDGLSDLQSTYAGVQGNDPRTIACWVRTTDTGGNGLVGWGEDNTGEKWHFRLNSSAANGVVNAIRTEFAGSQNVGTTIITDGEWHHVVSVFDGNYPQDVVHYVDGLLDQRSWVGATDIEINTITAAEERHVTIGSRLQADYDRLAGDMDEVRIYSRALTATEVQALYVTEAGDLETQVDDYMLYE